MLKFDPLPVPTPAVRAELPVGDHVGLVALGFRLSVRPHLTDELEVAVAPRTVEARVDDDVVGADASVDVAVSVTHGPETDVRANTLVPCP